MGFTAKQQAALKNAWGTRRDALQAAFAKQNKLQEATMAAANKSKESRTDTRAAPPKPQREKNVVARRERDHTRKKVLGHLMSASHFHLVPSMRHEGKAFPYHGIGVSDRTSNGNANDITIPAGFAYLGFFSNVGQYATIGVDYVYDPTVLVSVPSKGVHTNQVLSGGGLTSGPTSGRAMKCSVGMVCNTPQLTRGGRVYIVNVDQRFRFTLSPGSWTALECNAVAQTIRSHPRVQKHDLVDFPRERETVCHVVNNTDYEVYTEWGGTATLSNYMAHLALWTTGSITNDAQRPLSTVAILVEATEPQYITVTPRAAWYTRHALDTVAGQSMVEVPTATPDIVNAIHSMAYAAADRVQSIGETLQTVEAYAETGGRLLALMGR